MSVTRTVSEGGSAFVQEALKKMDPAGKIEKMRPAVQERMRSLLFALAFHGFGKVGVLCTVRTELEQKALYGKGRTAAQCKEAGVPEEYASPGAAIVTWSRPLESMHVHGCAMDIYCGNYQRHEVGGWNEIARSLGLTWGGTWKVDDWGHFETMGGY